MRRTALALGVLTTIALIGVPQVAPSAKKACTTKPGVLVDVFGGYPSYSERTCTFAFAGNPLKVTAVGVSHVFSMFEASIVTGAGRVLVKCSSNDGNPLACTRTKYAGAVTAGAQLRCRMSFVATGAAAGSAHCSSAEDV